MALDDAWSILKNSAAPAWARNIPEESQEDLAEREKSVQRARNRKRFVLGPQGYVQDSNPYPHNASVDEATGEIFASAGSRKDNRIQTNEALTNMRQGTHVDLRQGQLDQARKNLGDSRAAWRANEAGYNALTPPRTFTRRVLDRLTGQKQRGGDRMTEEEAMEGESQDVDWRTRQLQAARGGEELSGRNFEFRAPFADMNHQIQRMPAPDVGAESSFNTNPADATTNAFAPAPTWQGQELPKQQQSWVPPTQ